MTGDVEREKDEILLSTSQAEKPGTDRITHKITNFDALAVTEARRDALTIVEAAYSAIDTDAVIRARIVLDGTTLAVGNRSFDLSMFEHVRILGFGKASCRAVQTIEQILKGHVAEGLAIDVHPGVCDVVEVVQGAHPHPTRANVAISQRLVGMADSSTERDLVIVVVSGGGSSLLCYPLDECDQSARLFDDMSRVGGTITEMNTVRKHISSVKGGGLAGILYPAQVVAFVFCDIPGDHFQDVASGPTYYDKTTVADAQAVLDKYQLTGYSLHETPKDEKVFEKVYNVEIVSNTLALSGMASSATSLGYRVVNAGSALYDEPAQLVERMVKELGEKVAVIAGGEPRLVVKKQGGKGGRDSYTALEALSRITEKDVFIAFSSDGIDNSGSAGAIADALTRGKMQEKNIDTKAALESFDSFTPFEQTGDMLYTGSTDSNVSDLFVCLRS